MVGRYTFLPPFRWNRGGDFRSIWTKKNMFSLESGWGAGVDFHSIWVEKIMFSLESGWGGDRFSVDAPFRPSDRPKIFRPSDGRPTAV